MNPPESVEDAISYIEAIGGHVYRDSTSKYVWVIVCPMILGRFTYGCSTGLSLINWAKDIYSQAQI